MQLTLILSSVDIRLSQSFEGVILCYDRKNIDKALRICLYRLIIPIDVEQHRRHDTALWYTIIVVASSARLTIQFDEEASIIQ